MDSFSLFKKGNASMRSDDRQHFLIDNTKYEFVALCQIIHRSQIVVYEKVIHEKMLSTSTTSGLMSTSVLINFDISSLSLIFSTDSQEPSHTTLNGLLFDMKISLVLLNEFIYLSKASSCATTNRLSQILKPGFHLQQTLRPRHKNQSDYMVEQSSFPLIALF